MICSETEDWKRIYVGVDFENDLIRDIRFIFVSRFKCVRLIRYNVLKDVVWIDNSISMMTGL